MRVARLCGEEDVQNEILLVVVEPIREQHWTDIDIVVVVAGRTVHDNRTRETADVLSAVMTVPPVT